WSVITAHHSLKALFGCALVFSLIAARQTLAVRVQPAHPLASLKHRLRTSLPSSWLIPQPMLASPQKRLRAATRTAHWRPVRPTWKQPSTPDQTATRFFARISPQKL